jgi:hypothetical protein
MPRPIDRRIRLARLLARDVLSEFAQVWPDDPVRQTADVLSGVQSADHMIIAALAHRSGLTLDRGEAEAGPPAEQEPADVAATMGPPVAIVDVYAE